MCVCVTARIGFFGRGSGQPPHPSIWRLRRHFDSLTAPCRPYVSGNRERKMREGRRRGKKRGSKEVKKQVGSSRSRQNPVSPGSSHRGSARAIYHIIRLPSLEIKLETTSRLFSFYGEWGFLCSCICMSELTPWHPSLNASNNSSTGLIHRNVGCRRAEPLVQILTGGKRVIIVFHAENKHFSEACDFKPQPLAGCSARNCQNMHKKRRHLFCFIAWIVIHIHVSWGRKREKKVVGGCSGETE